MVGYKLICNINLTNYINSDSNKDSKHAWKLCMNSLGWNEYVMIQNKKYLHYHCVYEALIRSANYEEYNESIIEFVNHVPCGAVFNLTSTELKMLFSDYYNNAIRTDIHPGKICYPGIVAAKNEEEYEMYINYYENIWNHAKFIHYVNYDNLSREEIKNIIKDETECFKYFDYLKRKNSVFEKKRFDLEIENSIVIL
jgi:hypothetical protein